MHAAVIDWLRHVRARHRHRWRGPTLELGSFNMNGTARDLFEPGDEYVGVDAQAGPGVDVVSMAHEAPARDGGWQVVVSTEVFEHDPHWPRTVRRALEVTAPGGLFVFTCAAPGRGEHAGSPVPGYYRNVSRREMEAALGAAASALGRRVAQQEVRLCPERSVDLQGYVVLEP